MSEKLTLEFECDHCGAVDAPPLRGWISTKSLDLDSDRQHELCSPACVAAFFGAQLPVCPVVRIYDHDFLDDDHGGNLRPDTSRAAYADEMFDRWAA